MLLSFRNVNKFYGKNHALSDFSVELRPGIYALLGPNGAGKSSLINIITGNLNADGGEILFDGEDTVRMGERFREKIGFMPQYPGLYQNFEVGQFMLYVAELKDLGNGMKKQERKEFLRDKIVSVLMSVGLEDTVHKKIGALSGGMKQRLALAQAVLGDPQILILDEPTAGLDPMQRIAVRNFIAGLSHDRIILIATHVVSDVEFIANQVILLDRGVIVKMGPPQELIREISGKVWTVTTDLQSAAAYQERHCVTNVTYDDSQGNAVLRIISDEKPTENAVSVTPRLEDCYLFSLSYKNTSVSD